VIQFYIISVAVIGVLVPYTSPELISRNDVDSKASPFIIAIKDAGISGLDSVMNAVVMVAVLSVANSSMYGATRTLAALAEQEQAPKILAYYDRRGRPLVAIGLASGIGLLSYLYITPIQGPAFTWLLALSGLSSIFTWISICYSHIQFRRAWEHQGNLLTDLIYRSPIGVTGSWIGLVSLVLVLVAQFWVAIAPSGGFGRESVTERVADFFEAYLAFPVVILCYVSYKFWYRTKWVNFRDIDLKTGRNEFESELIRQRWREDRSLWPRWKKIYKMMC
jgi:amino acid transporter